MTGVLSCLLVISSSYVVISRIHYFLHIVLRALEVIILIARMCYFPQLLQRLYGATLLVFANKQDLPEALSAEEIRDVSSTVS